MKKLLAVGVLLCLAPTAQADLTFSPGPPPGQVFFPGPWPLSLGRYEAQTGTLSRLRQYSLMGSGPHFYLPNASVLRRGRVWGPPQLANGAIVDPVITGSNNGLDPWAHLREPLRGSLYDPLFPSYRVGPKDGKG